MNPITSVLDELRQQANRDGLASASTAELEKYAAALCFSQAFTHFGAQEYPQLCETVRTHLLRAHIGNLQSHVVELHNHITRLNDSNTKLQKLVVVLTVASLIGTGAQVWFAAKADKKPENKSPPIASQQQMPITQSAPPTQAVTPSSGQATKKQPAS